MKNIEGILLGLIQGVAEFLPISSSGHLDLYKYFFSVKNAPLLFDILLHLATLFSIIIVFRKKIASLFLSFFRFVIRKTDKEDSENLKSIAIMLLATLITAIVGVALKDLVKTFNIKAIPIGFFITSVMLLASSTVRLKKRPNILRTAAILGIAQGLAVFPGISRSGMTIATLLMLGFDENEVGEFSFILAIPAILGATILEVPSSFKTLEAIGVAPLIFGMSISFVLGLISLSLLLKILKGGRFKGFAFYLLPLSVILGAYFAFFS